MFRNFYFSFYPLSYLIYCKFHELTMNSTWFIRPRTLLLLRKVECLMQANRMLFAKLPDAGIMILMQEPDAGEKDLH